MTTARGQGEHPWVQPIIVAKTGTHADTIALGARASAAVYLDEQSLPFSLDNDEQNRWAYAFHQWLSGPFTKTVRRGSYNDLVRVATWAMENRVPYADVSAGDSAAIALAPMRYENLPKPVARLQVSGTDLPLAEPTPSAGILMTPVALSVDKTLTTGKATAQAAHALWMWLLEREQRGEHDFLDLWTSEGCPAQVDLRTHADLTRLAELPGVHAVRDNGLTEIAAGSLTAVATA